MNTDGPTDGPSLATLVRALIEDARTLIEAETGFWRALLALALKRARALALTAVFALFLAFFTLMAVVVGLLLALSSLVGAWGALGLVAGTLGLLTALTVRAVIGRARRLSRMLTGAVKDAR